MKNDTVKQVLTRIVKINAEAEKKMSEHAHYVQEQDIRIKHELKDLELNKMKDMRKFVKTDYNDKMQAANAKKNDILRASTEYTEKVTTYYNQSKSALVDDIFKDIFGDD